ncbi:hypothetical protein [Paenirhodobacter populi]|uniref:Uncharacterized protein n=1 Tax=Paenirhodobacter populi TaxID=2306993 RepID=A0A443ISU8_9RHOB|nr:hypothetical protein [Sinirhodobacter populi]RWR09976.1 hypothetical protein D2T33_13360 [Sinirhodobacter populi]
MSTTLDAARVYARIAVLRRKLLLQQAAQRVVAGIVALVALLIAMGFGTRALYLALVPELGELGATAVIGGFWLLIAVALGIYAASTPRSQELAELEQMERQARVRTENAIGAMRAAGMQAETITGRAIMLFGVVNALRRMLRRRKR